MKDNASDYTWVLAFFLLAAWLGFVYWCANGGNRHAEEWKQACLTHKSCEYDKETGVLVWKDDRTSAP